MKNTTNFKAVNWIDGMKINKTHFISSDNFHLEQTHISRRIFINENNFGILPTSDKKMYPFEIKLILEADSILITKYAFSLVMIDGTVISVNSEELGGNCMDNSSIKVKFKLTDFNENELVLIVKSNPFIRVEYGKIESGALKRPFSLPGFEFNIESEKRSQAAYFGDNFFVIAKFRVLNSEIIMDHKFIPPATSMVSLPELARFHSDMYEKIGKLEGFLLKAIVKYQSKGAVNLKETLIFTSGNLLQCLSRLKFEIKHLSLFEPPLNLLIKVKEIANVLSHSLEIRSTIGKDAFLNEVNTINGMAKLEFISKLNEMILLEYHHYNTTESLNQAEIFIDSINRIFEMISGHDKDKKTFDIFIPKSKRLT